MCDVTLNAQKNYAQIYPRLTTILRANIWCVSFNKFTDIEIIFISFEKTHVSLSAAVAMGI
jgi:hypothetical protein